MKNTLRNMMGAVQQERKKRIQLDLYGEDDNEENESKPELLSDEE